MRFFLNVNMNNCEFKKLVIKVQFKKQQTSSFKT